MQLKAQRGCGKPLGQLWHYSIFNTEVPLNITDARGLFISFTCLRKVVLLMQAAFYLFEKGHDAGDYKLEI